MKICVLGNGGREHAILWSLAREKNHVLYAMKGNGGTSAIASNVDTDPEDVEAVVRKISELGCEMAVIGPEKPLVHGLAERLTALGIKTLGPVSAGARIEGSKIWAKDFMVRNNIPTAAYEVFDDFDRAEAYVSGLSEFPVVIKADGLAAGKGVVIAGDRESARSALLEIMVEKKFGAAGTLVEIEEFLAGTESSYLVFTDGDSYLPMATSKDHKNIFDNDKGPNTGGMGTFSPSPVITPEIEDIIKKEVIERALDGFRREGIDYRGVLYAGVMLTSKGIRVLEFNCRFGDPETQVILSRLEMPLSEIIDAVASAQLGRLELRWSDRAAACVVASSKGYPGSYIKGRHITGIEKVRDAVVFHAGTKMMDGKLYTSGGRVLGVTAMGGTISEARETAYRELQKITYEGIYYRKDIGLL